MKVCYHGNVLNRTKDNSTTEHSNNNMNMTETSDARMLCSDNISIYNYHGTRNLIVVRL